MTAFVVVVFLAAVGLSPGVGALEYLTNCPAAYKAISAQHTMCLKAGPGTLKSVDSNYITNYHNVKRGLEDGTDLGKVYWDSELAVVAAHWAAQCEWEHDKKRDVPTLPGVYVGQNMAMGYDRTWQSAIDAWHNERDHFAWGSGSTNGKAVGHYTQMVSKDVFKIGCGEALCPGGANYQVCNYATGWHSNEPYTRGAKCSSCPQKCSANLCDCNGLVCMNGGTLDQSTCTCRCQPNVSGKDCSIITCPSQADQRCSFIGQSHCENTKWSGTDILIGYMCPAKCNLCNLRPTSGGVSASGSTGTGTTSTNTGTGTTSTNTGNTGGGNTNTGTTSTGGTGTTACEDKWFCSNRQSSDCQLNWILNGIPIKQACPKLCGQCGAAGNNVQPPTDTCTEPFVCGMIGSNICSPHSTVNGKPALDVCLKTCGKC